MKQRRMTVFLGWIGFTILAISILIPLLNWLRPHKKEPASILVHCAAGLRTPVDELAKQFQAETGIEVLLQFGGSQQLFAGITTAKRGDLFIPGDDSYLAIAKERNALAETVALAQMKVVVAVKRGNPLKIATVEDLLLADVRVVLPDPDSAAVGKLARTALGSQWEPLAKKALVMKPTVNEIANDLKLGSADAGIVFDAVASQYPELEIVPLPELATVTAKVAAGVLTASTQPTSALRFARFLAATDRGAKVFERHGYKPVGREAWATTPELRLFAGAMLRPAIERTLADFQIREGVSVSTVYNGCGILVGQMKTGEKPDAYFACEASFMKDVKDIFLDAEDVSTNRLVILVTKENPHAIKSLRDLAKPGVRLGVGHEKQCALGALTKTTLLQDGTYEAVQKNVAVQSPTGDLLVNQLRSGSLDAVVAYISNAVGSGDKLTAIAVDLPCAVAAQPIASSRETKFPETSQRLIEALKSAGSRKRFEEQGFHWAK